MKKYDKKNITKKLKKNFLENFNIKIICFFIAIAVYITIGFFQRNEKTFICKLNITGLNENFMITNEIPDTIKVVVKDKQKILNNLSESDFNVRLDLSDIDISSSEIPIKRNIPNTVESIFGSITLIPKKIKVIIEKTEEKNVPVNINHIGDPENGYIITNTSVDPAEVKIHGSEKVLDKIKYIETEKINLTGLNNTFKKEVNLMSPNGIKIIGKTKAEVTIDIEKSIN